MGPERRVAWSDGSRCWTWGTPWEHPASRKPLRRPTAGQRRMLDSGNDAKCIRRLPIRYGQRCPTAGQHYTHRSLQDFLQFPDVGLRQRHQWLTTQITCPIEGTPRVRCRSTTSYHTPPASDAKRNSDDDNDKFGDDEIADLNQWEPFTAPGQRSKRKIDDKKTKI